MACDRWDEVTGYCCGTCRFFSPKDKELGRCRRHAPTMGGFPVVYPGDDWCGDHKIGTNPHKEKHKIESAEETFKRIMRDSEPGTVKSSIDAEIQRACDTVFVDEQGRKSGCIGGVNHVLPEPVEAE